MKGRFRPIADLHDRNVTSHRHFAGGVVCWIQPHFARRLFGVRLPAGNGRVESWRVRDFAREDGAWCLNPAYKCNIKFLEQDIRRELPVGPFDLMLCRNLVFTYFDDARVKLGSTPFTPFGNQSTGNPPRCRHRRLWGCPTTHSSLQHRKHIQQKYRIVSDQPCPAIRCNPKS